VGDWTQEREEKSASHDPGPNLIAKEQECGESDPRCGPHRSDATAVNRKSIAEFTCRKLHGKHDCNLGKVLPDRMWRNPPFVSSLDHVVSFNRNRHRATPKNAATSRVMTINHQQLVHIFGMHLFRSEACIIQASVGLVRSFTNPIRVNGKRTIRFPKHKTLCQGMLFEATKARMPMAQKVYRADHRNPKFQPNGLSRLRLLWRKPF
jgi:hypothetical protein